MSDRHRVVARLQASMGPRRWSRGRGDNVTVVPPDVLLLQWGHGDGAVEEYDPQMNRRLMLRLQWGHGDGAVEELCGARANRDRGDCFNGATAMEPWKRAGHAARGAAPGLASMGPRRWSRGRGRGRPGHGPNQSRFNGATAMEPWKSAVVIPHRARWFGLQWGHGDGAVEEGDVVPAIGGAGGGFNGATAMEPWKRPHVRSGYLFGTSLQWGHGDGAVEEICDQGLVPRIEHASMGPRRWSRGRGRPSWRRRRFMACFNGATAMEPWKSRTNPAIAMTSAYASMGPRRWSRGRE